MKDIGDGGPVALPDEERCQWRCGNRKESYQSYCSEHSLSGNTRGQKRRRRSENQKSPVEKAPESSGVYTRTRGRKEKVLENRGCSSDDEDRIVVCETRDSNTEKFRENNDRKDETFSKNQDLGTAVSGRKTGDTGGKKVAATELGRSGRKKLTFVLNEDFETERSRELGEENCGSAKEDEGVSVMKYSGKAADILEDGKEEQENGSSDKCGGRVVEKGSESENMTTDNCGDDGGPRGEEKEKVLKSKDLEGEKGKEGAIEYEGSKERRLNKESLMCHQCQRNDKGRVIRCKCCMTKRYCIPCLQKWYPLRSEESVAEICPFCCGNCNCKSCLHLVGPIKTLKNLELTISDEFKVQHFKYLLGALFPYLKKIHQEQMSEKKMESKIRGLTLSEMNVQNKNWHPYKPMNCGNCKTSIPDLHRSCPNCSYDLCLTCCQDICNGNLQGGGKEATQHVIRGLDYLHGGYTGEVSSEKGNTLDDHVETCRNAHVRSKSTWKQKKDGSISCPPKDMGGCGRGLLELKHVFPENFVSELVEKVEQIFKTIPESPAQCCSCFDSMRNIDYGNHNLQKVAFREDSNDNYLYYPTAKDIHDGDLNHFQWHWSKGEPVIVSNVLEGTTGLSWEPMVMWRALRQIAKTTASRHLDVKAMDCLTWCEIKYMIIGAAKEALIHLEYASESWRNEKGGNINEAVGAHAWLQGRKKKHTTKRQKKKWAHKAH